MTNVGNLKPGWQRVKFGDVVRQVKNKVDPETSGLERFVAGEHMTTDDLRIRSWGTIGDGYLGPAFNTHFKPGQVLYGSRRTYLRKVALADFEGICANTTFVLESKDPTALLPELLPFIMQTQSFNEHSVKQSKGSVNPYVNFTDLARFEFPLPPFEVQQQTVKVLLAIEEQIEALKSLVVSHSRLIESQIDYFLARWNGKASTTIDNLVVDGPRNGLSPKVNADENGFPTLSISAVREGAIETEGNIKYAKVPESDVQQFLLQRGDVLVVRGNGNKLLTGKCGIVDKVPLSCFYPDLLIRLRFDEKIIRTDFAVLQWNSPLIHNRLISRAKSTNGIWKINGADIRKHSLIVPPLEEQDIFLSDYSKHRAAKALLVKRILSACQMKHQFLQDHFSGD